MRTSDCVCSALNGALMLPSPQLYILVNIVFKSNFLRASRECLIESMVILGYFVVDLKGHLRQNLLKRVM